MQYDLHFVIGGQIGGQGPDEPGSWTSHELIRGSTWSVDAGTIEVATDTIRVVVETEHRLDTTEVCEIGRELCSTLFTDWKIATVLHRPATTFTELQDAAPTPMALCLDCGGVDGSHDTSCPYG